LSPALTGPATPAGETITADEPANEIVPASEALEHRTVPNPDKDSRQRREPLERRLKAVIACLEDARQTVVAAEIAGAGIEAVRPAIDALQRSEFALREARAKLFRGDATQAALPLEAAEAACRAARELVHPAHGLPPAQITSTRQDNKRAIR
jgi:hypothetical protein